MWGWKNAATLFPEGKSTDGIRNPGKPLIKKNLIDALHAGVKGKVDFKIQILLGTQNSSALHSVVMAWQCE